MLSRTSKMPCESISLDARQCKTGSKLAKIKGSVCNGCYALKGFYNMPSVKNKMAERMNFFNSIDFVPRMIEILEQRKNKKLFRWFDSGDVQSELMAHNILDVCEATPHTMHWIPSKEAGIWKQVKKQRKVPGNVILRISATMIDGNPSNNFSHTSTVHIDKPQGFICEAYTRGGKCGPCTACWNKEIKNISYPKH